eukprot:jgi/Tetstr1/430060/TSEL_019919.t1
MTDASVRRRRSPKVPEPILSALALLLLLLSLGASGACSIADPGEYCTAGSSPRVAGCQAPVVLRGTVLPPGPLIPEQSPEGTQQSLAGGAANGSAIVYEDLLDSLLIVRVRVDEILKAGNSTGLRAPPFEVQVSGFQPCCTCGTEPPGVGQDLFFFVQPVSADAGANQTVVAVGAPDLPEFELAVDFIGSGVAVASEETEVEVREGAAAEAAGLSCEAVYCAENPFCEGEYTDVPCPSLLNSRLQNTPVSVVARRTEQPLLLARVHSRPSPAAVRRSRSAPATHSDTAAAAPPAARTATTSAAMGEGRLVCGATLALLAAPLVLVLLFDVPTLLGWMGGGGAVGAPALQGEAGRRELLHRQVKALQDQLAGLKQLRPAADAPLAEVQRWQEMRELLKRQVHLVMEDISDSADGPPTPQASAPARQDKPPATPRSSGAAADLTGVQPGGEVQAQLPEIGAVQVGEGEQTVGEAGGASPAAAAGSNTGVTAPSEVAGALSEGGLTSAPPVPFTLRAMDSRYMPPPKGRALADLPDTEGSWRYCYERSRQCQRCTLEEVAPGSTADDLVCSTCTSCPATLSWPDAHPRENPVLAAKLKLPGGDTLDTYVKFPCIHTDRTLPAAGRVDAHRRCNRGLDPMDTKYPVQHILSIQRITDDCGLAGIAARYWNDTAMSVVEDGPFVNQEGIFAQAAPGRPLEKIRGERRERVRAIPRDQILEAALHDFLLCEGDRHMGNIYLDDDNNIMLIDNDKALGNQAGMTRVIARQANLKCQPSSLFLPMTMESYRLNNGDLGYLDYRCHVGEDKGLWVPPKTRECLEMMAGMTAQQVKEKYGILYLEWAEDLRTRAKDLLELGFWQALLNAVEHSRQEHDRLEARRPPADDERYRGWRGAFWRPLLATHCDP